MEDSLPLFYKFPNNATHCNQAQCGFSLYRGVLVQWDEDRDTRVLTLLDDMPASVLEQLLVVQEHEAGLCFVWKHYVPKGYEADNEIIVEGPQIGHDVWVIGDSTVAEATV